VQRTCTTCSGRTIKCGIPDKISEEGDMGAYNSEDTSSDEDTETVQRTTRSGRTITCGHIYKDMMWY
jgi:hypothetical protein